MKQKQDFKDLRIRLQDIDGLPLRPIQGTLILFVYGHPNCYLKVTLRINSVKAGSVPKKDDWIGISKQG